MGDIGSADKLRELVLKHTALSVLGMFQVENDGVINFDNLSLQPLSVIPIGMNSRGLMPIKPPGDISIAEFLDQKLAPSIARTIKGPELPPIDTLAMSATEAAMRGQEQAAFSTPNLRLLDGCFMPIVERMLEVLSGPKLGIVEPFKLDGRVVKAVPVSPLAKRWREVRAGQVLAVFGQVGQMMQAAPALNQLAQAGATLGQMEGGE